LWSWQTFFSAVFFYIQLFLFLAAACSTSCSFATGAGGLVRSNFNLNFLINIFSLLFFSGVFSLQLTTRKRARSISVPFFPYLTEGSCFLSLIRAAVIPLSSLSRLFLWRPFQIIKFDLSSYQVLLLFQQLVPQQLSLSFE
jgi:hypothetical protein